MTPPSRTARCLVPNRRHNHREGRLHIEKKSWASILCGCLSASLVAADQLCPDTVRVTFFDHAVPPLVMGVGEKFEAPAGLLVKWVRAGVASTGCPTQVAMHRRPVRRAYVELERGETDLVALATATPANLKNAVYPLQSEAADTRLGFFRSDNSLWVLKSEHQIRWNGVTLTGPTGFMVGVPRGTLNETLAREHGWEADIGVNGNLTIMQLLAGRFPVVLVSDTAVMAQPDDKLALLKKLKPTVTETWYYSPASKEFYGRYPGFVQQYWLGLCTAARADKALAQSQPLPACGKSTR